MLLVCHKLIASPVQNALAGTPGQSALCGWQGINTLHHFCSGLSRSLE